jgi:hypothetical protein
MKEGYRLPPGYHLPPDLTMPEYFDIHTRFLKKVPQHYQTPDKYTSEWEREPLIPPNPFSQLEQTSEEQDPEIQKKEDQEHRDEEITRFYSLLLFPKAMEYVIDLNLKMRGRFYDEIHGLPITPYVQSRSPLGLQDHHAELFPSRQERLAWTAEDYERRTPEITALVSFLECIGVDVGAWQAVYYQDYFNSLME